MRKRIFGILWRFLQPDQQEGLYAHIRGWRNDHPQELQFSFKRFDEIAADRANSRLAREWEPSGLFRSVRTATRQVEKARLLAERTMFLSTRMPLLAGYFADAWSSQMLISPEFKNIMDDMHRLVNVAEQLPNRIATERELTINQAVDRLSAERKAAINQMMSRIALERKNAIGYSLACGMVGGVYHCQAGCKLFFEEVLWIIHIISKKLDLRCSTNLIMFVCKQGKSSSK